jgi:hypothetical protein
MTRVAIQAGPLSELVARVGHGAIEDSESAAVTIALALQA